MSRDPEAARAGRAAAGLVGVDEHTEVLEAAGDETLDHAARGARAPRCRHASVAWPRTRVSRMREFRPVPQTAMAAPSMVRRRSLDIDHDAADEAAAVALVAAQAEAGPQDGTAEAGGVEVGGRTG